MAFDDLRRLRVLFLACPMNSPVHASSYLAASHLGGKQGSRTCKCEVMIDPYRAKSIPSQVYAMPSTPQLAL